MDGRRMRRDDRIFCALSLALLITLVLVAVPTRGIIRAVRTQAAVRVADITTREQSSLITVYDTALTTASRMYAATGDRYWRERHDEIEPKVTRLIDDMERDASAPWLRAEVARLEAANERMVAMEREAIRLRAAGDTKAALALLSGAEYQRWRDEHRDSIASVFNGLRRQLAEEDRAFQQESRQNAAVLTAASFLLIVLWLSFAVYLHRLLRQRRQETALYALLADVATALAHAADDRTALQQVAGRLVPQLADWCAVDLQEEQGWQRPVLVHGEGQDTDVLATVAQGSPGADRWPQLFADDRSWLYEEAPSAARLAELLGVDEATAARLGARDLTCLALKARKGLLGVVMLGSGAGRPRTGMGASLLQTLAGLVAYGLENLRLYEQVRQAVQDRERLLAIVSHDMRSPLTTVQLAIGALARRQPELTTSLGVIQGAIGRLEGLIRDLLDLSLLRAGRMQIETVPLDLGRVVQAQIDLLRPQAEANGVTLAAELPAVPVVVAGDAKRLSQALGNLLGNALKFTPADGTITVSLTVGEAEGTLTVADTGPGIAPEVMAHMFDPFWRPQGEAKSGTGLGLFIAKGVVEAHGGRIQIESGPGRGSRFSLHLPVSTPPVSVA